MATEHVHTGDESDVCTECKVALGWCEICQTAKPADEVTDGGDRITAGYAPSAYPAVCDDCR